MPRYRNLAGHYPGPHYCGDRLVPEGSAPHYLKAEPKIKGLGIKQQCWLQAAVSVPFYLLNPTPSILYSDRLQLFLVFCELQHAGHY